MCETFVFTYKCNQLTQFKFNSMILLLDRRSGYNLSLYSLCGPIVANKQTVIYIKASGIIEWYCDRAVSCRQLFRQVSDYGKTSQRKHWICHYGHNRQGGQGGTVKEEAITTSYIFYQSKNNETLRNLKTATWQEAKLSKDLDGNFSFLVANFFLFTFEEKKSFFFFFKH